MDIGRKRAGRVVYARRRHRERPAHVVRESNDRRRKRAAALIRVVRAAALAGRKHWR